MFDQAPADVALALDQVIRPAGTPASSISSNSRVADRGVAAGGLSTTALPEASAGAILCAAMFRGELKALIPPTTPRGVRSVKAIRCDWPWAPLDRHHLAHQPAAFLGRNPERLGGARDLVGGILRRDAGFRDDQRGQFVARSQHPFADRAHSRQRSNGSSLRVSNARRALATAASTWSAVASFRVPSGSPVNLSGRGWRRLRHRSIARR